MKHRRWSPYAVSTLLIVALGAAAPVQAIGPPVVERLSLRDLVEWTQEMYLQVVPRPMPSGQLVPEVSVETLAQLVAQPSVGRSGSKPTVEVGRSLRRQIVESATLLQRQQLPIALADVISAPVDTIPLNRGSAGLDFSSSRLIPGEARLAYPYMAVGKLVFEDNGSFFGCSASVISARLVLTAGHCVHDGVGSFFTSFQFAPGYHEGEAPFGIWTASDALTTTEWSTGGGTVLNAADFGLLVTNDQNGMRIGDVTGWLGWKTNNLVPNHVTMVAYPGNHDSGEQMHQVNSSSWGLFLGDTTNNAAYGSDMGPGASGSPWVQNFGDKSVGQSGGENRKMNRIVGVTSAGPGKEDGSFLKRAKWLSSSTLGPSFKDMVDEACAMAADNCSRKGKPTDF